MEQVVKEYIFEKNIRHDEIHLHIDAIDKRFMASAARKGPDAATIAAMEEMKLAWNRGLPADGSRDHQKYSLRIITQNVRQGRNNPYEAGYDIFMGPSSTTQIAIANYFMTNDSSLSNEAAVARGKSYEIAIMAVLVGGAAVTARVIQNATSVVNRLGYAPIAATVMALLFSIYLALRTRPVPGLPYLLAPREQQEEEEEPAGKTGGEMDYYDLKHNRRDETRREFMMRAGMIEEVDEAVAGLPVYRANFNDDGYLIGHDFEGDVKKDQPNTKGLSSNSGNIDSRLKLIPKLRGPQHFRKDGKIIEYAQMGNIIAVGRDGNLLEKDETAFRCIRCMALKADGRRCNTIIAYSDAMKDPGIFCGTHNKNPNQQRVRDLWAVDAGCVNIPPLPQQKTGPASMKQVVSDTNKLRF